LNDFYISDWHDDEGGREYKNDRGLELSGFRTDQVGKSVVDIWVHPWLCHLRKTRYICNAKPFPSFLMRGDAGTSISHHPHPSYKRQVHI